MKIKLLLLPLLLFAGSVFAQKPRYTGGISGNVQGDNAMTVEAFSQLSSTNLERTSFLITNKTADEVEISFEMAITYSCNRVKKEKQSIRINGYKSYHTGDFLNSTSDKNCIINNTDGTKTSIVGITYLILVIKNYSADLRKKKIKFDGLVANVSKYYNAKDYENAIEALTRVAEVASTDEELQIKKQWDTKITNAIQEAASKNITTTQNNSKTTNTAQNQTNNTTQKNTNDDFWNDKPTNLERGGDNKEAYKVYEKRQEAEAKKAREDKAYVNKINQQLAENERARQESARKIDAWGNNMYNTYYAAQAATDARNQMNENSKLYGNYNSVQELEAEFNQKYYAINQDVQRWNDASNQSIQSGANLLLNDGSSTGQAAGELVGMLGAWANNNRAAREARERKESLERQKEEALKELNRKKWNAIVALRTKLFEQFTDGGTPLSKHKIQQAEVYCFVYSFPSNGMNETAPNLLVSNVFAVAQYSDGTWPFKNTLVNDVKTKTNSQNIVWMGYYTKKEMAEQMRNSLINLSQKAQIKPLTITYTGTTASATKNNDDFWGTGEKMIPAKQNTQKKEDDFWNN